MVTTLKENEYHVGSAEILNQLQLAEVHSAILANNWIQVESVLFANPFIAKEVDPFDSQTILHKLCKVENAPLFTLEMLIMLNPMALAHRDYMDYLPIHYASQYGSRDLVRMVCEAYKVSLVERIGGRLPIHLAAEYNALPVVEYLVEMDKSILNDRAQSAARPQDYVCSAMVSKKTRKSSSKASGLPLHFACKNYRNPDIIMYLLDRNAFAAAVPDDAGDFPLHIILRYGTQMNICAFKAMLGASPAVASVRDGMGNFPLATALNRMCTDSVIYLLMESSPLVVAERDSNIRLPIELATNQDRSLRLVFKMLLCDIPIDIDEITYLTLKNHGGSWHHILSSTQDMYFPVVRKVLQRCNYSQIRALSEAKDKHGNAAKDIATPVCLNEINFAMRMCNGTLQVVDPNPAFKSQNSETEIYYGFQYQGHRFDTIFSDLDFQAPSLEEYSDDIEHEQSLSLSTMKYKVNIKLSDISTETRSKVIIKATTKRDVFERDTTIRRDFHLSPQYVAALFSSHLSLTLHLGANLRKGMHCIVMECADATFENMIPTLKCSDLNETMDLLYSLAKPLFYLHRQLLIHGDFGPHNIGKFDDQFKLLGVGGSVEVGHFTDISRGFYLPPEAIRVNKKSFIRSLMVRSSDSHVQPIRAYPSFDVWAFGCTMFELLTGKTLSLYSKKGFKLQRLHKIASFTTRRLLKEIKDSNKAIHPQLIQLLVMILDPNPQLRIKSMEGILFRLEGIIGGNAKVGILQRHVLPLQLSFEQSESVSPVSSEDESGEEVELDVKVYDTCRPQVLIPLQEARFSNDTSHHVKKDQRVAIMVDGIIHLDETESKIMKSTNEGLDEDTPQKNFFILPTQELKHVL